MAVSQENVSMALFCDFENVALGVQDANYDKFDIKRVLERLLLKGSIVVKKAYCDWGRYQGFKAAMHEANFELIDIPHVRQSGKNSADIRLVVDALDLCYTKLHVDTFVIISGDSDFSPLVSKLRENAKQVIGVGVKRSTSDLLIANCDEFIFYDDLVRESQRSAAKRERRNPPASTRRASEGEDKARDDLEARRTQAIDLAVETFEALASERGDGGKIWASVLKEAIKRRRPDFNESYYGFRAFGNMLEAAQERGLLSFGRDEKSGAYVYRHSDEGESVAERPARAPVAAAAGRDGQGEGSAQAPAVGHTESGRRSRSGRKQDGRGNGRGERSAARHGRPVDAAEAASAPGLNDTQADAGVAVEAVVTAVQDANPAPARDQGVPAAASHAQAGQAPVPQAATEAPAAPAAEAAPRRTDSRRAGGRSASGGARRQSSRTEPGDSAGNVTAPVVAPAPVVNDTPAPVADTAAAAPKKAPRKRTTKTAGTTATRSRRTSKTAGAETPAKTTSQD